MEFSEYLTRIQGALVTLNRKNGLRRDEKEGTKKLALYNTLYKITSEYEGNESELRKTFLYLLFNSNFSFNEEVAKDNDFCHVVNSAPTVDKCLLVETLSLLNLNNFICELILYGHIVMCLEYLEVLKCELRYNKSLLSIESVGNVLSALNKRLHMLKVRRSEGQKGVEESSCKLSYYFKEFLGVFSPPHKISVMKYIIKSLLSLLQSCLHHRCKNISEIEDTYKVYSLSLTEFKIDSPPADSLDLEKREDILCLVNMLELNLNLIDLSTWMSWSECEWQSPVDSGECSRTVQEVIGLEAFLCKQELHKFCDDLPEAAKLSAVLTNMAIKPVTDEDEIEKAKDISEVITKVMEANRPQESRKKWLIALLKFSWYLKEEEVVHCIEKSSNLLDCSEGIDVLQKKVSAILRGVSESHSAEPSTQDSEKVKGGTISEPLKDRMKNLVFEAYPRISAAEQGNLVGKFYEEFGLINCFHVDDFEGRVTETLNKAVNMSDAEDQLISDVCVLCLQSPVEVLERLLVLGIGCHSQITFVVEVLKLLSLVCQLRVDEKLSTQQSVSHSPDPGITLLCHLLSRLMKQKNWNEAESSNLLQLVIKCLDSSLLLQDHFLQKCIIPGLEECMENSSWNAVDVYVEMLNTVLTIPSSLSKISNPVPILAYILLILEKGRFEMKKNFSVPAASTCELVISHFPVLLENILGQALLKEKDLDWLRRSVLSASPLSQYYYSKLWPNAVNANIEDFKSLITLSGYNEPESDEKRILDLFTKDSSKLSQSLFTLLPSCTTSEWLNIANSLKSIIPKESKMKDNLHWHLLRLVSSVLIVMIIAAKRKYLPEDKSIPYCIEFWFKNYVRIVKDEFLSCCKSFNTAQSTDVFMTIIMILEEVPEDENIQETCSFLALHVLSEIVEITLTKSFGNCDVKSENVDHNSDVMKIISCISLMNEGESKKGLARKVLEFLNK